MKYKTIFIDLDDTILDTNAISRESLEELYRDCHFDRFFPTFDDYFAIYMPNNLKLWKSYRDGSVSKEELIIERMLYPLRPFGIDDTQFALDLNQNFLHRTTMKSKLLPHTIDVLEFLHAKYKLYILSNGFEEVQYKKIANSGLSPFFDGIVLSDEIGFNKPSPEIFDYALKKAQTTAKESLMIGDSIEADILGARNCNIDQVWCDFGVEEFDDNFEPTYRITSLLELKIIL